MFARSFTETFPARTFKKTYEAEGAHAIVDHVIEDNKTLAAIYDLAVITDSAGKLMSNPRISCIVNLNLDSLLEAYDSAKNCLNKHRRARRLHTVENSGVNPILFTLQVRRR